MSDTFINRVLNDNLLVQAYIDSEPKFKDRKIPFKDILREAKRVNDEARNELLEVLWHNVAKVKQMYAQVLHIDLGEMGSIARAIQVRHDIVHRNGRRKDGSTVLVDSNAVEGVVQDIRWIGTRVDLVLNPIAPVDTDEGEGAF